MISSGSHLAVIDTKKENSAITGSNLQVGDSWLGCNDIDRENEWICHGSTTVSFGQSEVSGFWRTYQMYFIPQFKRTLNLFNRILFTLDQPTFYYFKLIKYIIGILL